MITQECIIDFTLPGTLRKFSVENFLSSKNLTGYRNIIFNSDTFQIHIMKPFLEILKSTKVKSTLYSL